MTPNEILNQINTRRFWSKRSATMFMKAEHKRNEKIFQLNEQFCPLICRACATNCVCYVEGKLFVYRRGINYWAIRGYLSYCGNAMFTGSSK